MNAPGRTAARHGEPGAISTTALLVVAAVLLALTATTALLSRLDLGPWNLALALGIAAAKAILIALYFMHLRVSRGFMSLAALGAVLWLAILLAGVMDDYATRAWLATPGH